MTQTEDGGPAAPADAALSPSSTASLKPPTHTEVVKGLLVQSGREGVPIRKAFVQQPRGSDVRPGPLRAFVVGHDERGLDAYLFVHALASGGKWDCTYPLATWARVLDLGQTCDEESAKAGVSKVLRRLEDRGLLARRRVRRLAEVTLLHEDGSGQAYTRPRGAGDGVWFTLPYDYWYLEHHRTMSMPAKTMLLIGLSLAEEFALPLERMPEWYGISADSAGRGLSELRERELLVTRDDYVMDHKSPIGWRLVQRHTLRPPYDVASRRELSARAARRRPTRAADESGAQ